MHDEEGNGGLKAFILAVLAVFVIMEDLPELLLIEDRQAGVHAGEVLGDKLAQDWASREAEAALDVEILHVLLREFVHVLEMQELVCGIDDFGGHEGIDLCDAVVLEFGPQGRPD